ncbi:hypothetical protein CF326_g4810 [Tilletia indica]|nr:hypothetical protein CF326_g4810 [Tilletia indica]
MITGASRHALLAPLSPPSSPYPSPPSSPSPQEHVLPSSAAPSQAQAANGAGHDVGGNSMHESSASAAADIEVPASIGGHDEEDSGAPIVIVTLFRPRSCSDASDSRSSQGQADASPATSDAQTADVIVETFVPTLVETAIRCGWNPTKPLGGLLPRPPGFAYRLGHQPNR